MPRISVAFDSDGLILPCTCAVGDVITAINGRHEEKAAEQKIRRPLSGQSMIPRTLHRCTCAAWTVATVACASSTAMPPPAIATLAPLTTLGPGDVFEVKVFGEDSLSGSYRVASDGTVHFSLIGNVTVAGLTAGQAGEAIQQKLSRYIKQPDVSIFVKEFNSKKIYVFGQVQRPGTFPYEDGMNIIQAITLAGGFDKLANKNTAYVTRRVEGREQRLEVSIHDIREGKAPNYRLEPGDIVFVAETLF
jgi:protein involved in polysaccharide export with SLBB domain